MNPEDVAVVDFETMGVDSRPDYPPVPVGVSIKLPGHPCAYYAWGHPTDNNCTVGTARSKLLQAFSAKATVFHHSAFDLDIAQTHLSLPVPRSVEDTLYLSFLHNPYEKDLGLKPLGEKYLKLRASEQGELRDWIVANIPEARRTPSKWGEHIWRAPGTLAGKYANGDVLRTHGLYVRFKPDILNRGMAEAYGRELACTQISLDMERGGVRVDRKRLGRTLRVFEEMDKDIVRRLCKRLHIAPNMLKTDENPKGFNLNSSTQLADALLRAGKLSAVIKTRTGKVSTKISNLQACCTDKELLNLLSVRSVMQKYRTSFMIPWLEKSRVGGRIQPNFNQVRGYDEGGGGARSGRYSSSDPNLQNVPANPADSSNREVLMLMESWLRKDYGLAFRGMRDFIVPDEDSVMICVDYNQQELRILAHFERGVLMRAYLKNPRMDIHEYCRQLVREAVGIDFPRKHIKVTVFGIVYGMGLTALANRLEVDRDVAAQIRDGIYKAVPGIRRLMEDLKDLARHDEPLRTWGGREYYCEEEKYDPVRGEWRSFEYKMLNYKIQPSAADCTKQGMINVREQVPEARIAIQVHDELVCMAPDKSYGPRIAKAMCDVRMRVPMLADPKYTTTSWARAA